jgi:hypothetical protein
MTIAAQFKMSLQNHHTLTPLASDSGCDEATVNILPNLDVPKALRLGDLGDRVLGATGQLLPKIIDSLLVFKIGGPRLIFWRFNTKLVAHGMMGDERFRDSW